MINIESDKIYMTAGEICYALEVRDGALYFTYFGRRVELEDDLTALCGKGEICEFAPEISAGQKKCKLEFTGARTLDVKPHRASALDGGKTAVVGMRTADGKISAELYITPYPRGGFSRRAVFYNNSDRAINIINGNVLRINGDARILSVADGGDVVYPDGNATPIDRAVNNFAAAVVGDGAYGFASVYGDGVIDASCADGVIRVDCRETDRASVAPNEVYMSPELLAVYSDNGVGGAARILHDIMRETLGSKFATERRPVVLFCPPLPSARLADAAKATGELGCDVFCIDAGVVDAKTLADASAACKAAGIKFGIKLDPYAVEKNGALFGSACKKTANGNYVWDLTAPDGADLLFCALETAIRQCDIEYLMIDLPRGGIQSIARGVYAVRHKLRRTFAELNVEWGIVPHKLARGRSLCYPPCMTRTVVTLDGRLKSEFDVATIGCLGYEFDPASVNADIKRAVRAQIFSYQDDAPTVMLGDSYFLSATGGGNCLMSVTKDKSKAYVVCENAGGGTMRVYLDGLDEHNLYHVRELNKTFSGAALVNCGVPIPANAPTYCLHIRQVADYEN